MQEKSFSYKKFPEPVQNFISAILGAAKKAVEPAETMT